jgi:hypothetical protein
MDILLDEVLLLLERSCHARVVWLSHEFVDQSRVRHAVEEVGRKVTRSAVVSSGQWQVQHEVGRGEESVLD